MATLKVFLCVAVFLVIDVSGMDVSLSSSGRTVRGSNITFTATVSGYTGETLKFSFHDNASPQHNKSITIASNVTTWTVEYTKNIYEPGDYTVYVGLMRDYFGVWIRAASATTTFQLTDTLNGNLILNQNNEDLSNSFVAVNKTVRHYVKLPDNELQFLKQNSSSIATYWFIDCVPYGSTEDFALNYTYYDTMNDHYVEAIVIANNEPLPPLTTTTPATTTPETTTTPSTTTSSTTTPKPPATINEQLTGTLPMSTQLTISSTVLPKTNKSAIYVNTIIPVQKLNGNNVTRSKRSTPDYSTCKNSVPIGKNYTYGRYEMKVSVRASTKIHSSPKKRSIPDTEPSTVEIIFGIEFIVISMKKPISTINITGLNWLQHGDLLNLQVKYTGSPPFYYCIYYKLGQYNVTGNETCAMKMKTISNDFPLVHYFSDSEQHTVVVVIENDIGKTVSRATINIYKTSVHAQLSVIVIPVFFCLVAVILVVFGIAYYQHRSRHTVEVADFDFGQAHPDYKTFTERLRDSFRNAFNFRKRDDTDPLTSNSRYDSMSS